MTRDHQAQYRAQVVQVPLGFHTQWSDILPPEVVGSAPFSKARREYQGTTCKWV